MRRTASARPPAEACARARPASISLLAARPHTRRRSQHGPARAHPLLRSQDRALPRSQDRALPQSQDRALPPARPTAPLTAPPTAPPACEGRTPSLCWRGRVARKRTVVRPRRPRAGWPPRARLRWSLPRRGAFPRLAPEARRTAASRPICGRTSHARWNTRSSARSVQRGSCLS